MEGATTEIVIHLVLGGAEPKGGLSAAGERRRAFAGWSGLISGLASIVCAQPPTSGPTDGD